MQAETQRHIHKGEQLLIATLSKHGQGKTAKICKLLTLSFEMMKTAAIAEIEGSSPEGVVDREDSEPDPNNGDGQEHRVGKRLGDVSPAADAP